MESEENKLKSKNSSNKIVDLFIQDVSIAGFRAPFIVWGVFFGSAFWIVKLGNKKPF